MLWKTAIYKSQLNFCKWEYCLFALILNNRDKFELNAFFTHHFGTFLALGWMLIYIWFRFFMSLAMRLVYAKSATVSLRTLWSHLCQPVFQQQEQFCFVCSCLAHWLIFDLHTAQLELSPIPIQNPLSRFFEGFHYCSWAKLLKHLFDCHQGRRKKHI